jgi:hypothetical protein
MDAFVNAYEEATAQDPSSRVDVAIQASQKLQPAINPPPPPPNREN